MVNKYSLIIVIVNNGHTDLVMEASRNAGARGGTVIHARGTGNAELESFYGIPIQPEKEMVLIIVETKIKDKCLESIYKLAGLKTQGQGIAFSLPVEDAVGLSPIVEQQIEEYEKQVEKSEK